MSDTPTSSSDSQSGAPNPGTGLVDKVRKVNVGPVACRLALRKKPRTNRRRSQLGLLLIVAGAFSCGFIAYGAMNGVELGKLWRNVLPIQHSSLESENAEGVQSGFGKPGIAKTSPIGSILELGEAFESLESRTDLEPTRTQDVDRVAVQVVDSPPPLAATAVHDAYDEEDESDTARFIAQLGLDADDGDEPIGRKLANELTYDLAVTNTHNVAAPRVTQQSEPTQVPDPVVETAIQTVAGPAVKTAVEPPTDLAVAQAAEPRDDSTSYATTVPQTNHPKPQVSEVSSVQLEAPRLALKPSKFDVQPAGVTIVGAHVTEVPTAELLARKSSKLNEIDDVQDISEVSLVSGSAPAATLAAGSLPNAQPLASTDPLPNADDESPTTALPATSFEAPPAAPNAEIVDTFQAELQSALAAYRQKLDAMIAGEGTKRVLRREYYAAVASLCLLANQTEVAPKEITEMIEEIGANQDLFDLTSSASSSWIRWSKRDSAGVLVAGKLVASEIGEQGRVLSIQTKDKKSSVVRVVTSLDPLNLQVGDENALIMARISEDSSANVVLHGIAINK